MLVSVAGSSLIILLAASSAPAAIFRGTIDGWDSPALAGARVTLANSDTSIVLETRSAIDGTYRFENVSSGSWLIGASRPGYAYRETLRVVGTGEVVQGFLLGPDDHPGRWTTIGNTDPENLYATNSASLLPDGRIFFCHDTQDPVLFDPVAGIKTFPPGSSSLQGCHIPTLLPDGRLMFIGGQDTGDFRDATRMVKAFDPATSTWEVLPLLNEERWYPGLARLGDGRFLVMGGGQRPNAQRTETCEIYDPRNRTWTLAASMSNPSDYPPAVLLRNGKVLRSWWPAQLYDPELDRWNDTGAMVQPNRFWPGHCDHSLFRLADGRACAVGIYRGSLTSPSMIELYDPTTGTWSLGANAGVTRSQPEAVLLPTGQIFVAGGKLEDTAQGVPTNAYGQTKLTDLYDAATNSWRRCADMRWFREYHATTLLIPDGRVVTTAGTGGPANPGVSNDIEAFEPPYLFRGIRPRIDAISATTLPHGSNVTFSLSRTDRVTGVTLVGTGAVTHWVDGGLPLVVPLSYTHQGSAVTAAIPSDLSVAPAGHYMLFALVDDIPSVGVVVNLRDSVTVGVPPFSPTRFVGSIRPNPFRGDVELSWYQPDDGSNLVRIYDILGRPVMAKSSDEGPGWHRLRWNGRDDAGQAVGPGVYFLQIETRTARWTARIVHLGQ